MICLAHTNAAAAGSGCPTNTLQCGTLYFLPDSSAARCEDYQQRWTFDLAAGTLTAQAAGNQLHSAQVTVSDTYTVLGLPAGTPVDVEAGLVFHGASVIGICTYFEDASQAHCDARILDPGTQAFSAITVDAPFLGCTSHSDCCWGTSTVDSTLRIPVSYPAGQAFTLTFELGAQGSNHGSGTATGQLEFFGLPRGAEIVSCQGYRQGSVTAAVRSTWGRLKSLYR